MPQASPSALPPACSSVMMWVTYEMTKHNGHSARCCATCEPAEEAHLPGHQSVVAPTNSEYLEPPANPLHVFAPLITAREKYKGVRLSSSALLCKWAEQNRRLKPNHGLLQFMIFCSKAINNSEPLCGRLYSQVCIYSSLWLQRKFRKWPFWDGVF